MGSGSTGNYPKTCEADASCGTSSTNARVPVDRSRFPRPFLKIRRFSIPIYICRPGRSLRVLPSIPPPNRPVVFGGFSRDDWRAEKLRFCAAASTSFLVARASWQVVLNMGGACLNCRHQTRDCVHRVGSSRFSPAPLISVVSLCVRGSRSLTDGSGAPFWMDPAIAPRTSSRKRSRSFGSAIR